jgi:dimeric dUTPase (all-alpha-NTP-PPase superfamily)
MMNLQKLFELQRQLDERIMEQHPELKGQKNLDWKILALQVEIGELANEWRGFKKWSHDQKPRTRIEVVTGQKMIDGVIEPITEYKNPLLEEYVDCLHFILSIGLDLNIDPKLITGIYECPNVLEQFNSVFEDVAHFWSSINEDWGYESQVEFYVEIFRGFKALGRMLGFTWEQIEEAYLRKNAVNHQRQESGY